MTKIEEQIERGAFFALKDVWKSKVIKCSTNIIIFNSHDNSVLLYGSSHFLGLLRFVLSLLDLWHT